MNRPVEPDPARRHRFEAIVSEVHDPLARYLRRRVREADAWDLLGEVLLVIWRRLDQVPEDRVVPWAYGVARLTIANHRRGVARRARLQELLESEAEIRRKAHPSSVDPVLTSALDSLSEADRELLRLWAWEELEAREIAQVLGITANAVSLRLGRARKRLAKEMLRQDPSPSGHRRGEHSEENSP